MSPSCLFPLLAGLLAMLADRSGREWLVWALAGSLLSPLCAALALLAGAAAPMPVPPCAAPPQRKA